MATPRKPAQNVLFITADQFRGDCLSAMGHPLVQTPHLDALATEGTLFTQHYAQSAPCGPSRASLYTGLYMHSHRSVRNGTPLDGRHTNVALEARAAGYRPALFGYTDTSLDPRVHPEDVVLRAGYQSVLPGFDDVVHLIDTLDPWIERLKQRGYTIPKNTRDIYTPRANYPGGEGQGRAYAPPIYTDADSEAAFLTDEVMAYIAAQTDPWFAHVSYLPPHPPFVAAEPYNTLYDAAHVPAPKRAASPEAEGRQHAWLGQTLRHARTVPGNILAPDMDPADYARELAQTQATYYGLISQVDAHIGRLIAHLKDEGQYDTTLIVFTSDHGEMLGDRWLFGKLGYFDQSYHIPLIVRDPRAGASGGRVDRFTESVDVMPTILDWLGLPCPRQCQGRSLVPFTQGKTPQDWRTEVHWEYDFRNVTDPDTERALNIHMDECAMTVIRDEHYKYVHFPTLPPLFFDLADDPDQMVNRADDPAYADRALIYAQKMLSWRMMTDDKALSDLKITSDGIKSPAAYRT